MSFIPRDCWVGLSWKTAPVIRKHLDMFGDNYPPVNLLETIWHLCIIPCFPIIWKTYRKNDNVIDTPEHLKYYIDIPIYTPHPYVLMNKNIGKSLRNNLGLNDIDQNNIPVIINIPTQILSLNSSFFYGLFEDSLNLLGPETFKEKYIFKSSKAIRRDINFNVDSWAAGTTSRKWSR